MSEKQLEEIKKRLDALIKLQIETMYGNRESKFTESNAIKLLYSVNFTPTEIAKLLGKKGPTAVAPYLYKKEKSSKKESEKE